METTALKRKLNLFDATMLVSGNMIGAGIFSTTGLLARELPHPILFLGIWVIGGVITLCGVMVYADMAARYPRTGGDFLFLTAVYGPWAGFLLGWISFWIITPGSIAVLSIALGSYLNHFSSVFSIMGVKITALAAIGLFSLINLGGIRFTGSTHNAWTIGSIALLMIVILFGFSSGHGDWRHFFMENSCPIAVSKLFGPAMAAVIFSYSGWFTTTYIGDEVRRPRRNLPLSFLYGTIIVIILYTAVNAVYLYALPIESLKGTIDVVQAISRRLMPGSCVQVLTLAIVFAIAANINATILSGSRLTLAAAGGASFSRINNLHRRFGIPHHIIVLQAILSAIYVMVGSFEKVLECVVFVMLLSSIATGLGSIIVNHKERGSKSPFGFRRVMMISAVFICAYAWIALHILFSHPGRSIAGLLITLSGMAVYYKYLPRQLITEPGITVDPSTSHKAG